MYIARLHFSLKQAVVVQSSFILATPLLDWIFYNGKEYIRVRSSISENTVISQTVFITAEKTVLWLLFIAPQIPDALLNPPGKLFRDSSNPKPFFGRLAIGPPWYEVVDS